MDNGQECAVCGSVNHASRRCPKLRKRKCYECGQYADHLAQECRDRKAGQPQVTFEVTLDVEPFGPLDFVSIDDWAAAESDEELEPVDEWIAGESEEDGLQVPPPSRKRQAEASSPQPGPSRRYRSRSRSPPAGPSKQTVDLVHKRPSYVDTHFHMDLLKRNGTQASEWDLGNTDTASFGGAIACFSYPALYMDHIRPKKGLSHFLRRHRIGPLLRDSSLVPRPELVLGGQYGCHPRHAHEWDANADARRRSLEALRSIFRHPEEHSVRPLAVGETGIDLSDVSVPPKATQLNAFEDQIWIASEFNVPIVLHLRGPRDDDPSVEYEAMDHMELHDLGSHGKVHRHCFRHSVGVANDWLSRFPNTKFGITAKLLGNPFAHETAFATNFPLKHILLETDAPHCGSSNPTNALRVAERIASLRGIDVRIVVEQTTRNAEEFYGFTLQH